MSFKKPFRAVPIKLGPRYLEQQRKTWRLFLVKILGGASAAGLVTGLLSSGSGPSLAAVVRRPPPASNDAPRKSRARPDVYYPGCNEARAAGAAPIYRGQPNYRPGMDGDGDGIACEPYRGRR
jgi:hypothetical protein